MYFNDIEDLEQAKLRYRNLAKQLHHDAGDNANKLPKKQR